ncbi:MAG: YHS domain-containing protein, partial [Dehalococcoidia bacterium]
MDVDTDNPPGGQSEHEGTTYYFCAPGCKVAFNKEPEKYLAGDVAENAESGAHEHQGHDHGHGDGTGGHHESESKPGFFARLFGKK